MQHAESEWHPRLRPEEASARRIRGAMGLLLAYPWFDRISLWGLTRYFFPLSRLWAAATVSNGVPERFLQSVPLDADGVDMNRLQRALFVTEAARAAARAVDDAWQDAFFGPARRHTEELVAIETTRRDHQHALNTSRWKFRFLLQQPIPIIKPETPEIDDVAAIYGASLVDRKPFFTPPEPMPAVEKSRQVPGSAGTEYWLRFRSPSERLQDTVYAHVYEPEGVKNPPTLIFGHGICVEFDHWHGLIDEVDELCRMGIRVIRAEAPWHGRRRHPGHFSGETIVARSPLGLLDAFTGALREWSVLIDWARRTSDGRVAIGGSSLGALMSLLCADVARDWAQHLRPEALLLITHCGHQRDALINGALAKVWKSHQSLIAKGWTRELTGQYIPVLDPSLELAPVMAPENIVTVLGRYDHVTPFASGLELMDAWRVPARNRFIWNRGHFSVPMTMIRNNGPLRKFGEIMFAGR